MEIKWSLKQNDLPDKYEVHAYVPGSRNIIRFSENEYSFELPLSPLVIFEVYAKVLNYMELPCFTKQAYALAQQAGVIQFYRSPRVNDVPPNPHLFPFKGFITWKNRPRGTVEPLVLDRDKLIDLYNHDLPNRTLNGAYELDKFVLYPWLGNFGYAPLYYQGLNGDHLSDAYIENLTTCAWHIRKDPFLVVQLGAVALRYCEDLQFISKEKGFILSDMFEISSVTSSDDCEGKTRVSMQVLNAVHRYISKHPKDNPYVQKLWILKNYKAFAAFTKTGHDSSSMDHMQILLVNTLSLGNSKNQWKAEHLVLMDSISLTRFSLTETPSKEWLEKCQHINDWQPATKDSKYESSNIGMLRWYYPGCSFFKRTTLLRIFGADVAHGWYAATPITNGEQGIKMDQLFVPGGVSQWMTQSPNQVPQWDSMIAKLSWRHAEGVPTVESPINFPPAEENKDEVTMWADNWMYERRGGEHLIQELGFKFGNPSKLVIDSRGNATLIIVKSK
jgi:hypothetical protein